VGKHLEDRAILLTVAGALGMGVLGVTFALLTGSEAILLDGVISFVGLLVGLLTLRVAHLLRRPGDERYPFGYAVFEPVLNFAKGLLIGAVIVFAFFSAVGALLGGGRPIVAGTGVVYALIAAGGCALLAAVTHRMAKRTGSPIVAVDAKNWIVDGLMSAGLAVALGGVLLLERTGNSHLVPYADPVIVILLALVSAPFPIRVIRENWGQIVGQAPDPDLVEHVRGIVERTLEGVPHKESHLRLGQIGRLLYLQLYVLVEPDAGGGGDGDRLRALIHEAVGKEYPRLAMDVICTSDPVWADRAIGS
jgi:cation diffusion facilitator family transporter